MSLANNYEQYMLEIINAARAKVGAQPLAFDGALNSAAEKHSAWMIATDTYSHTGSGGSSPYSRMVAAGYSFTGSWTWGENLALVSTRSPAGFADEIDLLHSKLMNSSTHRTNLLSDSYREVGLGFEVGQYAGYEAAFITQDFARTGSSSFITGVAFSDRDGDRFYDVGEGLGGLTVTARNNSTGAVFTKTTEPAGGYDFALAAGTYTVTFSGSGMTTTTQQVTLGSRNVKVDYLASSSSSSSSSTSISTEPAPTTTATQPTHTGTSSANTIQGGSGDDYIVGLGGNDILYGNAGNDRIEGGSGNDKLYGGSGADRLSGGTGNDLINGGTGADTLTGGSGYDTFVFDTSPTSGIDTITDFNPAYDTIRLHSSVFTGLPTGKLASSAFQVGTAANDASDRIIYNKATGAVFFDPDGSGAAAAQQFAQLTPGTAVTNADFSVV